MVVAVGFKSSEWVVGSGGGDYGGLLVVVATMVGCGFCYCISFF